MSAPRRNRQLKIVTSGFTWDERRKCRYSCAYCFAAEEDYTGNNIDSIDEFITRVSNESKSSLPLIQLGHDTEFFQNPKPALDVLRRLSGIRCLVALATKMPLQGRILDKLSEAAVNLKGSGGSLAVMVSIPVLWQWRQMEPDLPSPWRRLELLQNLSDRGITGILGIRPLLPTKLMSDNEVTSLATCASPWLRGVILGPYWFRRDKWEMGADPAVSAEIPRWMDGSSEWLRYEDKERTATLTASLRNIGVHVYDGMDSFFEAITPDRAAES